MTSGHRLRSVRSARLVAMILAVVAATVLAPATARADLLDVTCASSSTVTYNRPLTRTSQDVTVGATVLYGPCVSATVPGLTSGVTIATFSHPAHSCADLLSPITTVFTITWNTGQTSTVTANTTATLVGDLAITSIGGN